METKCKRWRQVSTIVIVILILALSCSMFLNVRGGVIDKVLIKLNLREASEDWTLVAWERCIDKLDYDADIVFFGDSIISGSDFQKTFPNKKIVELGLPGDSLLGMANRVEMISSLSPEKIFIMGGINSLGGNSINKTIEQYENLLQLIIEGNPNAEIFVFSVLPISEEKEASVVKNSVIKEFNTILQDRTEDMKLTYVDLFSLYELNGKMNPEYTKDGVHLYPDAYLLWENAIADYID